jgi:hypothetical protein
LIICKEQTNLDANLQVSLLNKIITSTEDKSVKVEAVQYQRLVGKLIYLAQTRPDLAYVVRVSVSPYMTQKPDTCGL